MKLTNHLTPIALAIPAAAVLLLTGCATGDRHDFNHDFGENLTTDPKFYIQDENDHHFKITVDQGNPSNGGERVVDLKEAASTVADAEAKRLGWEKWQLNYISERDQGWMHVVVAEVKREKYVEPTYPNQPGTGSL